MIVNNPEKSRYELRLGDRLIGLAQYRRRNGRIVLTHTEVDESCSGRGFGSALVKAALDDAKRQGSEVVPLCPFVADYIRRHPEYEDLVAPRYAARSAHRARTARRHAASCGISSAASSSATTRVDFGESFEAMFVSSNGSSAGRSTRARRRRTRRTSASGVRSAS